MFIVGGGEWRVWGGGGQEAMKRIEEKKLY
jgi:hypothetical protein